MPGEAAELCEAVGGPAHRQKAAWPVLVHCSIPACRKPWHADCSHQDDGVNADPEPMNRPGSTTSLANGRRRPAVESAGARRAGTATVSKRDVAAGSAPPASVKPLRAARQPIDWREVWLKLLPPVAGLALLIRVWALLTIKSSSFPTPAARPGDPHRPRPARLCTAEDCRLPPPHRCPAAQPAGGDAGRGAGC